MTFEFRGLTFRTLDPIGIEVKVGNKWLSTDFLNRRTLEQLASEIPDIGTWGKRMAYLGSVRFPDVK